MNMKAIYEKIISDPRYKRNVLYGKPRRGHAEGTVEAHIKELENNLHTLDGMDLISEENYWKLEVLIHVHDSFKAESARDVSILDPNSHSTLARNYLATLTDDKDLLNIVQYHDLGYAVYRKFKATGRFDEGRMATALAMIDDYDLFLLFAIIDSCTESKGREMITWFVKFVSERYVTKIDVEDILPAKEPLEDGAW